MQDLTPLQRRYVAEELADTLRGFNSNFDRNRFIAACKGE
jgi:hypothetical protein